MPALCTVCLGNICRSPMAEAVFRHLLADEPSFTIDSRGTGAWHVGASPDPRTIAACRARGIACDGSGQQLAAADYETFDWLLVMDDANYQTALERVPAEHRAKIQKLGDFDPDMTGADLADPYYGGEDGFPPLLEQTIRACRGFLKDVYGIETADV